MRRFEIYSLKRARLEMLSREILTARLLPTGPCFGAGGRGSPRMSPRRGAPGQAPFPKSPADENFGRLRRHSCPRNSAFCLLPSEFDLETSLEAYSVH
jgi:hypothetical protein